MKVGILTAARTNNNGTDLQAFAMQQVFCQFDVDVEIINYKCDKLENSHSILFSFSICDIIKIPFRIFNNINHWQFRKKYFNFSKECYDKNTIKQVAYDRIVVGSDQIWNLDITGFDMNFYLPFETPNAKKYSYAASLGKTDISEWQEKYNISKYLNKFERVSVREESGVIALEKIDISAQYNLDPLLLITQKEWLSLCTVSNKEPYLFLYLVERNDSAIDFAKRYAKKHGLRVKIVNGGIKPLKGIKSYRFVSVKGWLNLMSNAELVITNSYHGLSMAINLHKNFRLFELSQRLQSNARMLNLLDRLELNEYVSPNNCGLEEKIPNWEKVDNKIAALRKESFEYIQTICSEN